MVKDLDEQRRREAGTQKLVKVAKDFPGSQLKLFLNCYPTRSKKSPIGYHQNRLANRKSAIIVKMTLHVGISKK